MLRMRHFDGIPAKEACGVIVSLYPRLLKIQVREWMTAEEILDISRRRVSIYGVSMMGSAVLEFFELPELRAVEEDEGEAPDGDE